MEKQVTSSRVSLEMYIDLVHSSFIPRNVYGALRLLSEWWLIYVCNNPWTLSRFIIIVIIVIFVILIHFFSRIIVQILLSKQRAVLNKFSYSLTQSTFVRTWRAWSRFSLRFQIIIQLKKCWSKAEKERKTDARRAWILTKRLSITRETLLRAFQFDLRTYVKYEYADFYGYLCGYMSVCHSYGSLLKCHEIHVRCDKIRGSFWPRDLIFCLKILLAIFFWFYAFFFFSYSFVRFFQVLSNCTH